MILQLVESGFTFQYLQLRELHFLQSSMLCEIFVLKELPNKPTSIDAAKATMDIKKLYNMTRNWQGDPCVPSNYSWDGLNCSDDNHPRIISLNMSSSNLTGEIATSFSNLKAIQSLDLSYNDLTGPLPEFLSELPNLNTL